MAIHFIYLNGIQMLFEVITSLFAKMYMSGLITAPDFAKSRDDIESVIVTSNPNMSRRLFIAYGVQDM